MQETMERCRTAFTGGMGKRHFVPWIDDGPAWIIPLMITPSPCAGPTVL